MNKITANWLHGGKIFLVAIVVILVGGMAGTMAWNFRGGTQQPESTFHSTKVQQKGTSKEEMEVKRLVVLFGKRIQNIHKPPAQIKEAIKENYSGLVTNALLSKWMSNPDDAPQRAVSSPWPDRIEIVSLTKTERGDYQVAGVLIWMTSMGIEAKDEVKLTVIKERGRWVIAAYKVIRKIGGSSWKK